MDIRTPVPTIYGDTPAKFAETWKSQITRLTARFAAVIEEIRIPPENLCEVPIIYVKKDAIVGFLSFLKTEQGFEYNFLSDLTAVDEEADPRFEVVLQSFFFRYQGTHPRKSSCS